MLIPCRVDNIVLLGSHNVMDDLEGHLNKLKMNFQRKLVQYSGLCPGP